MQTLDSNDLATVTGGRFNVAGGLYGGFGGGYRGRGGGLAMQMFNAQMMQQQAALNNQGMNNPATVMACCVALKSMMG